MMRILMKAASSMEKIGGSSPSEERCEVDLSTWELVNASQSDDEVDLYSFDGDDVTSEDDAVTDLDSDPADESVSPVDVISIQTMSVSPPMTLPVEMSLDDRTFVEDEVQDDDSDDEDDDGGGDYDDELMPWDLKGRFGKERIKKLGKRGPKPNRAKRMQIYHNRPGCLFGKHGYGVQHSFI